MSSPDHRDPDQAARRSLARHRSFATGLLVVMAALTLGSYALPPGWGTDLLQAAAKAGFVGGIADWFAITALFRHPLGLPIPHTAIIPAAEGPARPRARPTSSSATCSRRGRGVAACMGRLDMAGILQPVPVADPVAMRPTVRRAHRHAAPPARHHRGRARPAH